MRSYMENEINTNTNLGIDENTVIWIHRFGIYGLIAFQAVKKMEFDSTF